MSKKLLAAALVTSSLFATGAATAANLVTLNPQANNNGAGVVSAAAPAFQAVGAQSNLTSTLVINGNTGVQTFSETGQIQITSFQGNGGALVNSGVYKANGGSYDIFANFTLTGAGQFLTPTTYAASPASLTFNISLFAVSATNQTIQLGTASLISTPTNFGLAFLSGAPAPNTSGTATTTLGALLNFNPAPGTTGINGFFQAPTPFLINIGVGNAGGNPLNTSYSVNSAGVVTIVTGNGANTGTANITFVTQAVPEPGALSLAGLALLGAAVVARRKTKKVVAA